jgi:signal peptide peptidase SppA
MHNFAEIRRAVSGVSGICLALETARAGGVAELLTASVSNGPSALDDLAIAHAFGLDAATPALPPSLGAIFQAAIGRKAAAGQIVTGESGRVGLLSFRGVAMYGLPNMQPFIACPRELAREVTALAGDDAIARVVIAFNSPGGLCTGIAECADAIHAAAQIKPVIGIVDPLAASAGYWLASQCSELIALASGEVGSVGVFALHVDQSQALAKAGIRPTLIHSGEHKVELSSFRPLAEGTREWLQQQADSVHGEFVRAVARGRRVSAATVRERFGRGRLIRSGQAAKLGMVDRLETTDDAYALALHGRRSRASIKAELAALRAEVGR